MSAASGRKRDRVFGLGSEAHNTILGPSTAQVLHCSNALATTAEVPRPEGSGADDRAIHQKR
ncbi:UNVERIFIED_CONTAM: hypothetical protein Slati_2381000 [Sesamum latifolium]|uniref:Uncharacterized protein n=1 Tax=Sesamum latifolium TaxID=2727402 RepID=A0AAW2WCJ1_9LAMI